MTTFSSKADHDGQSADIGQGEIWVCRADFREDARVVYIGRDELQQAAQALVGDEFSVVSRVDFAVALLAAHGEHIAPPVEEDAAIDRVRAAMGVAWAAAERSDEQRVKPVAWAWLNPVDEGKPTVLHHLRTNAERQQENYGGSIVGLYEGPA